MEEGKIAFNNKDKRIIKEIISKKEGKIPPKDESLALLNPAVIKDVNSIGEPAPLNPAVIEQINSIKKDEISGWKEPNEAESKLFSIEFRQKTKLFDDFSKEPLPTKNREEARRMYQELIRILPLLGFSEDEIEYPTLVGLFKGRVVATRGSVEKTFDFAKNGSFTVELDATLKALRGEDLVFGEDMVQRRRTIRINRSYEEMDQTFGEHYAITSDGFIGYRKWNKSDDGIRSDREIRSDDVISSNEFYPEIDGDDKFAYLEEALKKTASFIKLLRGS